jgi:hypothetical protein
MIRATLEWQQCRQVIIRLALISHASTVTFEPSARSTEVSRTGNRPPGGIDFKDDREPDFRQKSAEHFARRLTGCNTPKDVQLVLLDAERALDAWQRTPLSGDPLPGDPFFKRWVREHHASSAELARLTGVSRQYIHRIRQQVA